MLDDRKKKVLQAIVEEYINTAEPVSSNALTNNEELQYSSATIRNEMADLEKAGYLEKTHTSSGRIPSEKGYRYYVDELLKDDNISMEEIKYISDKLETKVNEIEDLTKIATTTISEITHYTTLAIGPSSHDLLIEEIKFVLLGPRMLMAIILTNTGMVKETIIKFDEDITEKQVETINYMFNQKLKGQPLQIIDVPLEEYLINEMKYSVKVIKPIIEQLRKKYWDARHNCYAYVLGGKSEIQRFSDDGEPSGTAGKPILEVITGNECGNCLCVVTRYFGGVLLGTGGLIRAYTNAAKEALSVCRLGELTEGVHAFLDVDYNYVGKVQYICAQNDITIVNTEYADGVTFELMMENAARNVLEKNMTEMSSGKICLRDTCSMQMYRDDTGKLCR